MVEDEAVVVDVHEGYDPHGNFVLVAQGELFGTWADLETAFPGARFDFYGDPTCRKKRRERGRQGNFRAYDAIANDWY